MACTYERIGCPWRGPYHEMPEHQKVCSHPEKRGDAVMGALQAIDEAKQEELRLYKGLFNLLSFEKITFNGRYSHLVR